MQLEIGRIDKAHGVKGDVLVTLTSDRDERMTAGSVLESDRGSLTVRSARPHQNRWLVSFAEISGRDQADGWRGTVLRAEPLDDPNTLWVHELVGATVIDGDGVELGVVEAVEQNPASDLLVIEAGLIPLTFFVERREDGTIVVDPPDGLLA